MHSEILEGVKILLNDIHIKKGHNLLRFKHTTLKEKQVLSFDLRFYGHAHELFVRNDATK